MSLYLARRRRATRRRLGGGWRKTRYLCALAAVASFVSGVGLLLRAPVAWWPTGVGLVMATALLVLGCAHADQHAEEAEAPAPPALGSRPAHGQYYRDDLPTTPLDGLR